MANLPIVAGLSYKGTLDMFGSVYDYQFTFDKAEDGEFSFSHKILLYGTIQDQKSGSGKYNQLDDNNVEILYEDNETSFRGILKIDEGTISGTTSQTKGMFSGSDGKYELAVNYD